MSKKLTTEEFIKKARKVHGNKYDYFKVDYKNNYTKIEIGCKEHRKFKQKPKDHLTGRGCPACGIKRIIDNKTKTIKKCIEDFIKVHGNKYDYSKVKYKNAKTKIIITCKKHGEFLQTADSHITGRGCFICGGKKKLTTEEFISKAKRVHRGRYDYSKVAYKNTLTKVKIRCKKHGEFEQTPGHHLNGCGCPDCGGTKKSTTENFIKEAKKIHGDKYDYSKVKYKNTDTKVKIICKKHGEFIQIPSCHLIGQGCIDCGGTKKLTVEEFVNKARVVHGDKYDYSKIVYKNIDTKVTAICRKHGEFNQIPFNHLVGKVCLKCSIEINTKNRTKTTEEFISKAKDIHGNKYDYSKVKYKNTNIKVKIICKKHGEFEQVASYHLSKHGCPNCVYKNQGKVKVLLSKHFKNWNIIPNKKVWQKYKDHNHKRYCDFWIEKNGVKVIVEYDGEQHFKPIRFNGMSLKRAEASFKRQQKIDALDAQFCKENNIILHRIKYDEDREESIKKLQAHLKKIA